MKSKFYGSIDNIKARSFDKLDIKILSGLNDWPISIAHEYIPKNADVPYVIHKQTKEFVYILDGKALACVGLQKRGIKAGDYLVIPAGVKHRFVTTRNSLTALSVFFPVMNWDNLDAVMCRDDVKEKGRIRKKVKKTVGR